MGEIAKSVLGSVRLDSDVWEAVRAMPCSLNQYLRTALVDGVAPGGLVGTTGFRKGVAREKKRQAQAAKVAEELAASDLTAQVVEREDIEYGHHESLPRGEHVANMRAFKPPLLKPSEKKK